MYQDLLIAWKFTDDHNMPDQCKKLRELIDRTLEVALLEREIQLKQMNKVNDGLNAEQAAEYMEE